MIPKIREFLDFDNHLELHPKKIYLQHIRHGVPFLGAYLKPYRTYVGNRTKNASYQRIAQWNEQLQNSVNGILEDPDVIRTFLSSIHSYLGIMAQFDTYRLRRKFLQVHVGRDFWKAFRIVGDFEKVKKRKIVRR